MRLTRLFRLGAMSFTAALFLSPSGAHSEPLASAWTNGFHSKARLTAANLLGKGDGFALYAGVDIRLDKNWKTYWRSPGDGGGVPPEFDWSGSQNVKSLRVLYPLPKLLKDTYGISIGYKDKVIFPVAVTPADPSRPVRLRLAVYYGVCEDICIPAEARLELDVAPNARATISVQRDLMTAMRHVPARTSDGLTVTATKAVLDGASPHLLVTAKSTDVNARIDLFVVSRDGDNLPMAKRVERTADGQTIFRIDLKYVDKASSLAGKTLDLVLAANGRGIDVPWTVPPGS